MFHIAESNQLSFSNVFQLLKKVALKRGKSAIFNRYK